MIKATTIKALANNLNPLIALSKDEDKDEYVEIYNDILLTLKDRIINDELPSQTYFVAGQSGTGKTTALNFISINDTEIDKNFNVKYIYANDLLDPSDIDIIDLLLMLAFKLVQGTKLEEKYYEKLNELQKIHEGRLEKEIIKESGKKGEMGAEIETSGGIGFFNFLKLKAKIFTNYKMDSDSRKKTREIFQLKKPQLLEMINNLIDEYYENESNRKLLFIIDDLDKLRKINQIHSLFVDNRFYYYGLKCKKIIAIPVHLAAKPEIISQGMTVPQFGFSLESNPIDKQNKDENKVNKNRNLLKEVIKKRIEFNHYDLIEDDAIDEAINFSGGILRQFIHILYNAAVDVRKLKGKKITKDDVFKGWNSIKDNLDRTIISSKKIEFLDIIRKQHKPISNDDSEFIESLLGNQIIAYGDGTIWYDVNPIIKRTVEIYASKPEEKI